MISPFINVQHNQTATSDKATTIGELIGTSSSYGLKHKGHYSFSLIYSISSNFLYWCKYYLV